MIARLKGIIVEMKPNEVIIDVNGVGYQLFIPFTTYEKLELNGKAILQVYTLHKEDQFKLFGFFTAGEKALFELLISISGIGPSMALAILSSISFETLLMAVTEDNGKLLTKVPGIGKAKADKLIFELKRKIDRLKQLTPAGVVLPQENVSRSKSDALEALLALGYDEKKAIFLLNKIVVEQGDLSLEELIREALKEFSA